MINIDKANAGSQRWIGGVLVLISAAAYGGMAIFARMAYTDGVDTFSLLFLRFSIAAVFVLAYMALKRIHFPRGKVLLGYGLMGALGYVGQSSSYFSALKYASAGLVALLLYLYPVLVTVLEIVIEKKPLTRQKLLALALSFFGTVLTIGPQLVGQPLGVLLGISAATIYSVYILVGNRLSGKADVISSSATVMGAAALVFGGVVSIRGLQLPASNMGWCAVFAIVFLCTILAMITFLAGLERVGATNAAMLSTFEPVTTIVLAWLVLGEQMTFMRILGGLLILLAVFILARGELKQGS